MTRADAQIPDWAVAAPPGNDAMTSDEEVAAIIRRAGSLGIPAWRVTVALGLRLPAAASR